MKKNFKNKEPDINVIYKIVFSKNATEKELEICKVYWEVNRIKSFISFKYSVEQICKNFNLTHKELWKIVKKNSFAYSFKCVECKNFIQKYLNRSDFYQNLFTAKNGLCERCLKCLEIKEINDHFEFLEFANNENKVEEKFQKSFEDIISNIEL